MTTPETADEMKPVITGYDKSNGKDMSALTFMRDGKCQGVIFGESAEYVQELLDSRPDPALIEVLGKVLEALKTGLWQVESFDKDEPRRMGRGGDQVDEAKKLLRDSIALLSPHLNGRGK